jgi:hypothetical protein
MSDETFTSGSGLLPLVIGVTGGCEPCGNGEIIKHQAREIFQSRIKRIYPTTPLILLSTLAEGANRIVVDVALDYGAVLVAPLPIASDRCEKEAKDPNRFKHLLLKRASHWFVLPLIPGFTDADIRDSHGLHRNLQNALADAYIARYCQVLMALKTADERATNDRIGPDHIIEFKLNGRLEVPGRLGLDKTLQAHLSKVGEPYWLRRSALYPPENGPVYVVGATDEKEPRIRFPEEFDDDHHKGGEFYGRMHKHVEALNAHALEIGRDPELTEYREKSKEYLLTEDEAKKITPGLVELRACYHTADTLAMHFNARTARTLTRLCLTALIAAAAYIAFAHLLIHEKPPWPLGIYFLALAAAFGCYVDAQRRDYQNKYQDYRAIAEGLRVQFFWRLAGLDSSAAEYYLLKQTSELDWIRNVIRACGLRAAPAGKENMPLVLKRWIEDQYRYYSKATRQNRKQLIVYKYIGEGFLGVSLFLALVALWPYLLEELKLSFRKSPDLAELFPRLLAVSIALVVLYFLWKLVGQIGEQYKNLREGGLPVDDLFEEPDSASAEDSPVKAIQSQLARLTEKPLGNLLIGITGAVLVAGGVLLLPASIDLWPRLGLKREWHELLIASIGLTAVVGGLLHYYTEKRAFAEQAKQYSRMTIIFKNAAERFSKFRYPDDYENAASLVKELGIEALAENGDWVLLHRERPLEPVRSMEG